MMHIFYWAAYTGEDEFLKDYMLFGLKFSPFVGTYKDRSVLTGAVLGESREVIRLICSYKYIKTRHGQKRTCCTSKYKSLLDENHMIEE